MIRTLAAGLSLALCTILLLPESRGQEGQTQSWQRRLQGTWKREKTILNGKASSTTVVSTMTVNFTDNRFTRKIGEKVSQDGIIKIDPTQAVLLVELDTKAGVVAKTKKSYTYAVSVTDDVLIMALPSTSKAGGVAPMKIDSVEPGPGRAVYYYRRVKE